MAEAEDDPTVKNEPPAAPESVTPQPVKAQQAPPTSEKKEAVLAKGERLSSQNNSLAEGEEEEDETSTSVVSSTPYVTELHEGLIVVSSKAWFGLTFFSILVLAILLWGFFGVLPVEVQGEGLFTSLKGVFKVDNLTNGVVDAVLVKRGDKIKADQELVLIHDPEDRIKLEVATRQYERVKQRLEMLRKNVTIELAAHTGALEKDIAANRFHLDELEKQRPSLEEILKNKQDLYSQGLVNLETVHTAEVNLAQNQIASQDTAAKIKDLEADLSKEYRTEEIKAKEKELLDTEETLNLLNSRKKLSSALSPHEGTVIEVKVEPGQVVKQGDPLIWLEYPSHGKADSIVLAYVPIEKGKKIKKDDAVNIEVGSINMFEYGMIKGKVVDVSGYAVSPDVITKKVFNEGLAKFLMSGEQALVQVVIRPNLDPNTFSGYEWTSGAGPQEEVTTGTVCKVKITVDEIAPIYYLFPLWRIRHATGL